MLEDLMPLAKTLGMRTDEYTADRVVVSVDWAPQLCTTNGIVHGGVIMALADSAGGGCAFLNLPAGATGTSTIESKTNFLGTVRSGTVTATSVPLHCGATTIVVETAVRDGSGKLIAKTIQTQLVLRPRA